MKIFKSSKIIFFLFILVFSTYFGGYAADYTFASEVSHTPPDDIVSGSAVLIDAKSALVLFEKNAHEQDYPASITKVMTALLALEDANGDYDGRVHFSENAVFGIPRDSSHIAMDVDETLSLSDALIAMLLQSANEVAVAIGEYIDGTEEAFAAHMTKRAKELGADNTNFVNPNGLPDPDHYTTAYDMALIMREAVKYDKFLQIISMQNYKLPPTEKQPEQRPLNNSNRMILPGQFYNESVVGGKTGYTVEAGHTLVTYAKRGDIELICTVLRGEKNTPYTDTAALLDYGFSLYDNTWTFHKSDYKDAYGEDVNLAYPVVQNGEPIGTVTLTPDRNLNLLLPCFVDTTKITDTVVLSSFDETTTSGDIAGRLDFVYDGVTLGSVDLVVDEISLVLSSQTEIDEAEASAAIDTQAKETAAFPIQLIAALVVVIILLISALAALFILKKRRNAPMKLKDSYFKIK